MNDRSWIRVRVSLISHVRKILWGKTEGTVYYRGQRHQGLPAPQDPGCCDPHATGGVGSCLAWDIRHCSLLFVIQPCLSTEPKLEDMAQLVNKAQQRNICLKHVSSQHQLQSQEELTVLRRVVGLSLRG